jgi:hypothetical protein
LTRLQPPLIDAAMDSGSSLPLGSIAGIPVRLHGEFK